VVAVGATEVVRGLRTRAFRLMLALLFGTGPALGQAIVDVRARAGAYRDSDHTSVTTLAASAAVAVRPELRVQGGYLADIVSSASVDVVSAATAAFSETRHEALAVATLLLDELTAGATYRYSVERDWQSHTLATRGLVKLASDNTELGLGLSLGLNRVGRAQDPHFSRRLTTYGYTTSVSQVLDQKTLLGLVYEGSILTGFQSSPYRYVAANDARVTLLEHHPNTRVRHALGAELLRHLFERTSARLDYRLYLDTWGVVAHTGEVRFTRDLGSALSVSLRERVYGQRGAWFYERAYAAPKRYMTRDRELSAFWDSWSGAALELELVRLGPFEALVADLAGDFLYYRFSDFDGLERRTGVHASAGLGGSF
jgi:hypothetical protein